MSKAEKARDRITPTLEPGESIGALVTAQAKTGSTAKRIGKDVAFSAAASVALGALGAGVMRTTVPPQVWVVVTDRRVLLFEDGRNNVRSPVVGDLVFDAPRSAVAVSHNDGLFNEVVVADAETGDVAVRLNFGMRKKDAAAVAEAATA